MPKSKEERGEAGVYAERYRGNIGDCTGWDTSLDPSTLPPTRLTKIENARVIDGIVACRGGQEKKNSGGAMSGCVYGMIDVEGGVRFLLSPIKIGGNAQFDVFVESHSPNYVRLSESSQAGVPETDFMELSLDDSTKGRFCFGHLGDSLLMSTDSTKIYKVMIPEGDPDIATIKLQELCDLASAGATGEVAHLFTMPGFPNTVYAATVDGGVFSYDGTSIVDISPTWSAGGERSILFSVQGVLHAAGNLNEIQRYVNGAWAALTLPAGSFFPECAIEYNGAGYVGGHDGSAAKILVVAQSGTVSTGTVFSSGTSADVSDFAIWNGDLYYFWRGTISVTERLLVVLYGTSTTLQISAETDDLGLRLAEIGGRLFAGIKTGVAALIEINSDFLGFTTLVDRTSFDTHGAYDILPC